MNDDGTFTVGFQGLEPSIREIDNSSSRFEEITGVSGSNQRQSEVEESRIQAQEAERSQRETKSQTRIQQQEDKPFFLVRRK